MLDGLARQTVAAMPGPSLCAVVADNEGSEAARRVCVEFQGRSGIHLSYVHEPRRGISFARNACLDNIPATCDFFAFIDDDEVPEPDWLERLLEAQAATGADVVQGPVYPLFEPGAPKWAAAGEFFGWPRRNWRGTLPELAEYQELDEAYTNNVFVRADGVRRTGLRFDPVFALSGGEDVMFFKALKAAGNRIVYAPRARVGETVPRERATLWYRLRLEYRIANSPLPRRPKAKKRTLVGKVVRGWRESGGAKIASGIGHLCGSVLSGKPSMERTVVAGLRVAYGIGQAARALGLTYHPYR